MTDLAQPWPPGSEPGYLGNTEAGTVKPAGGECARVWPDGPPGADYHQPPASWTPDEPPPPRPDPAADFTWTPPDPQRNDFVTFDGSGSVPSDGAALTAWDWLFADPAGDAAVRSGETVTYQMSSRHGDTAIRLTVTDSSGKTDSTTMVITV